MARYHADAKAIDLKALQARLMGTDLIPSQEPLLDNMSDKMAAISKAGLQSVADLRSTLQTKPSLTALSQNSGVPEPYLLLLRRTINGFFPKPRSLTEVDWVNTNTITRLAKTGIKNTQQLFEAASDDADGLAEKTGVARRTMGDLFAIAGLCRIQWVAPSFARVLVAAGYRDTAAVAKADPEALAREIEEANAGARFYKGKVGLRDVWRLVAAAGYVK